MTAWQRLTCDSKKDCRGKAILFFRILRGAVKAETKKNMARSIGGAIAVAWVLCCACSAGAEFFEFPAELTSNEVLF
jgi:hypothetical protein